MTPDSVLTVKQCAELLQVSPRKIYQDVVYKRLPYFRLGKRVLFFRDDLVKWMQEGGKR